MKRKKILDSDTFFLENMFKSLEFLSYIFFVWPTYYIVTVYEGFESYQCKSGP